ncbi:MAG: lipopolysaccharide biosynthesis protein [Lentilitoribacter sp.]
MFGSLNLLVRQNIGRIQDYATLVGGSVGRLVISLGYFIAIANTLAVEDFGLFATASAAGIILSRLVAFGFASPMYRIATSKRRLLGVYTPGLIVGSILSLPVIGLIAYAVYTIIFADEMSLIAFMCIVFAEVIFWRTMEITTIILNGLYRFAAGSILVIIATIMKMLAAFAFAFASDSSIEQWGIYYISANAISAMIALVFYYPRVKMRWCLKMYLARWVDSLAVASSEIVYYAQAELDKILVLAIGGPQIAGVYAILMRLVDITALPIRSLFMLIIQQIMRTKSTIQSLKYRVIFEAAIAVISLAGILALALIKWLFPNILGENVAEISPYLIMVLLVPVFRNLTEYHSELLYAVNRTLLRTANAAIIGFMKACFLSWILLMFAEDDHWFIMLNVMFGLLYLTSLLLTYPAMRRVAPIIKKTASSE